MRRFNTTPLLNAFLSSTNFLTICLRSVFMLRTLIDGRFATKILHAFLAHLPSHTPSPFYPPSWLLLTILREMYNFLISELLIHFIIIHPNSLRGLLFSDACNLSSFQMKGTQITENVILMHTSKMYLLKNCPVSRTGKIFCSLNKALWKPSLVSTNTEPIIIFMQNITNNNSLYFLYRRYVTSACDTAS
jgi:hypothetical protein